MASELKPWRYAIKHGPEGEASYAWVYDDLGEMVGTMKTHKAKKIVDTMNTRAVPDVPELTRYDPDIYRRRDETILCRMVDDTNGEYVRYDQAAAMLAEALLQQKAWADKWDHAISRAEAAEAELAQIKAQEPVVWQHGYLDYDGSQQYTTVLKKVGSSFDRPLYAAPTSAEQFQKAMIEELDAKIDAEFKVVELKAEIKRYRKALTRITNLDEAMGHELTVNHAFDAVSIAVNALSEKEPS